MDVCDHDEHPNAADYRNRAERAEAECAELRKRSDLLAAAVDHEGYRSTRLKKALAAYRGSLAGFQGR